MVGEIRSTTGCWTCKLRKKKCPEEKPTCAVCNSLRLDCGGYGPRPRWMDGGAKEEEKLARIRETAKDVSSQKKRAAMNSKRRHRHAEEGGILANPSPADVFPPYPPPATTSLSLRESSSPKPLLIDGPPPGLRAESTAAYIAQNESFLLMHYLDYVFPCQFRFYQPSLEDGGRGWLLSLLLLTKPLYYAARTLAAYHRQLKYCLQGGMQKGCFQIEALQTQYGVAITELRRYLEVLITSNRERTLTEEVELLCSIVFLISIEGFISSTETWQLHISAALSIFPDISKRIRDVELQKEGTLPHRVALSFFSTLLAWYSITSSATIGWELFAPCSHDIDIDFIHFDKVIGCENWVMLAIKDTVLLAQWKSNLNAVGQLSVRELASRGNEIETRLNKGLDKIHSSGPKPPFRMSPLEVDHSSASSSVTRGYYFAAFVYLHVIISGAFPNLPEIRHAVAQSMESFKALSDPQLVNNLIWPFCISGCMAVEKEQNFFKEFSLFGNPNDGKFGASKARVVMEECWRLRKLDPDSGKVDWRAAMDGLGFEIMLV